MSGNASRLAHLSVPEAFHAQIELRRAGPPRALLTLAIVMGVLAAAVAVIVAWSRYVAAAAEDAARAAQALLYNSDIGAGPVALIFASIFFAGWLAAAASRLRGIEAARNSLATDLMREPARYAAVTDWLWRGFIRRHTRGAAGADDFLDRLGAGIMRDFGLAALAVLVLALALGAWVPARINYATAAEITDVPVLPFSHATVWPVGSATAVISGCPNLPRDGNVLIYRLRFPNGIEENLGSWRSSAGNRLPALEAIAARLPAGVKVERFSNPMGSNPLSPECIGALGQQAGPDGIRRLLRLLAVSGGER